VHCLIVVDAWKQLKDYDLEKYPWLSDETTSFGKYLNTQLKHIDCDIFKYTKYDEELMDEITVGKQVNEIPEGYDYYYFCGFHLGRCIPKLTQNIENSGCVLNLSLLFPEDSFESKKQMDKYFYYSYAKGFEHISFVE